MFDLPPSLIAWVILNHSGPQFCFLSNEEVRRKLSEFQVMSEKGELLIRIREVFAAFRCFLILLNIST